MIWRSLGAYQARQNDSSALFDDKVAALRSALANEVGAADAHAMRVAAFTGMPFGPLEVAMAFMDRDLTTLPSTIIGWSDWMIDFLAQDVDLFEALFGADVGIVATVARGVKAGGRLTTAQFEVLKAGLRAWLNGKPLREIELALGVAPARLGTCKRARELALKLANRKLHPYSHRTICAC